VKSRTATIASALLALVAALAVAALVLAPRSQPIVLTPHGGFVLDGEYPTTADSAAVRGPRYASWSGSDAHVGELVSAPFMAPARLSMMIAGSFHRAGESLELVRADRPSIRVRLETGNDPSGDWERRLVQVPAAWVGTRVRLVATDAGTENAGWVGLADVAPASPTDVVTNALTAWTRGDRRPALLGFCLLALTLPFPFLALSARLCAALHLPSSCLFAAVLVTMGSVAEALFFLTMVNARAGAAGVWIVVLGGSVLTVRSLRHGSARFRLSDVDAWAPFAIVGMTALGSLALACLGLSGRGPVTGQLEQWLALPPDNVLPHVLAEHIRSHAAPKPFFGDWLSSDRPPLQAGFDLFFGALVPAGRLDDERYEAISTVLQATMFGVMFVLCRSIGLSRLRAAGIVALSWFSTFFFVNTIFVWPKLLAGAYVGCAMLLVLADGAMSRRRAIGIGLATGLGLLSHGGVAFTVPALLVAWLLLRRTAALGPLAIAGITVLIVLAPWTWYQKVYDPPGDRLLKMHLAGELTPSPVPLNVELLAAYTTVAPATLLANKLANAAFVIGVDSFGRTISTAPLRAKQFFSERFGLGALVVPYLAALVFVRSRRPLFRRAGQFAWIVVGANLFWCLVMYRAGSTSIHQGSYLTMMLLYVAGGIVATQWAPVFVIVFALQVGLFVAAWQPMFAQPAPSTPGSWCALLALGAIGGVALVLLGPAVATRLRRALSHARDVGTLRRYLEVNAREVLTLAAIGAALSLATRPHTAFITLRVPHVPVESSLLESSLKEIVPGSNATDSTKANS
jgi:hypothetical protein